MDEPVATAVRRSTDDPSSFSRFYVEHVDSLLAYFMRRVLEVEVALDLTAETMAQAYLGRHRFRGSTDAEAAGWLYGIAERKLASYRRRQSVEQRAMKRLGLERPRPSDEAEARLIERETLADLREGLSVELGRLSAAQREVVELRFVQELPYLEIAQRLDISEQAARARVARGLKVLRDALNQQPTPMEGLS